jgi:hypothetical protein
MMGGTSRIVMEGAYGCYGTDYCKPNEKKLSHAMETET